jgi:hypothetical protein
MPLQEDKYFSTNIDGSTNTTYCNFCYNAGEFIDGCTTIEEKIEICVAIAIDSGMPKQQAEDMAKSILPPLKRWQGE